MSSVKVVDLQNEAVEEATQQSPATSREAPIPETIEEAKQETPEPEIVNEVVETANELPKEEIKEAEKPKPKRQTQKDKMNCGKCGKEMTIKTYRYSHEKICQGQLSERPVKPKAKPQPKAVPKPVHEATSETRVPQPIYEEEQQETQPVIRQRPPPNVNPVSALAQHYQLLQQQYIKQKQEKYNNLCQNMFKTKPKKR